MFMVEILVLKNVMRFCLPIGFPMVKVVSRFLLALSRPMFRVEALALMVVMRLCFPTGFPEVKVVNRLLFVLSRPMFMVETLALMIVMRMCFPVGFPEVNVVTRLFVVSAPVLFWRGRVNRMTDIFIRTICCPPLPLRFGRCLGSCVMIALIFPRTRMIPSLTLIVEVMWLCHLVDIDVWSRHHLSGVDDIERAENMMPLGELLM